MPTTDSSNLTKYHRPLTITHDGKAITVYLDCYDILALSTKTKSTWFILTKMEACTWLRCGTGHMRSRTYKSATALPIWN